MNIAERSDLLVIVVGTTSVFANLAILAMTLKLYTEYFKDKAQDRRKAAQ